MSTLIQKITLIGSGNIATQLGNALISNEIEITQVWSRNLAHANSLAQQLECRGINKMTQLKETDLFIIAVADDAIKSVALELPDHTPLVHTSGNTPLLERRKDAISGVFYPLQTFTKKSKPNWSDIPICIESAEENFLKSIHDLAVKISPLVKIINSHERAVLHASAVMVCNFTNHLGALAEEFLKDHNLNLSLLKPLIAQTFENISEGNVKSKQTGPAVREDYGTIDAHMNLFDDHPEIKSLYLALSKHIIDYHHGH